MRRNKSPLNIKYVSWLVFLTVFCTSIPEAKGFSKFQSTLKKNWARQSASLRISPSIPKEISRSRSRLYLIDTDIENGVGEAKVKELVDTSQEGNVKTELSGVLVLLSVPLSWGTYAPVVKYMYAIDPPIPGFVFSAGYYLVAAAFLLTMNSLMPDESDEYNGAEQLSLPFQGGLELGSYLFIGNCLQVVGLEQIPSDRAAFEVQLTTVMVPLLQGLLGSSFGGVSRKTWIATALAFAGVLTMGLESSENDAMNASLFSSLQTGDVLIFLAALAYSFHVIRLGKYAPTTSAISLAAAKASTEAALSFSLIAGLLTVGHQTAVGNEISNFFSTIQSTNALTSQEFIFPATLSCLWTGLVTCAYTIYAQSYGQRTVSPSNANLIYASQPLFSSLFAYVLLGEVLGPFGYVGGALIAGAVLLITSQDNNNES